MFSPGDTHLTAKSINRSSDALVIRRHHNPCSSALQCLLIYALYISIERFLIYRAVLKQDDQFVKEVRRNLRDPKKAIALCEQSEHIMASVFRAALNRLDQGKAKDQISLTFETRTTYVVAQLERHLNTLATISGAAPPCRHPP